jgi:hypothetical protein
LSAEIFPDPIDGGQQLIEDVKELERHAATERASSKCGTMHSGSDGRGGAFIHANDAERQPARERFGGHHDIGHHGLGR